MSPITRSYRLLRNLRVLILGFEYRDWNSESGNCLVQCYIRNLLQISPFLKRFQLRCPCYDYSEPQHYLSYKAVLPNNASWHHLATFRIEGIDIEIADLITLLLVRMPRLQNLGLDGVNLISGHWDGLFELLRVADFLNSFKVGEFVFEKGEPRLETQTLVDEQRLHDFINRVDEYVVGWQLRPTMKHPCLGDEEPLERSTDFLSDVFRLCEESGSEELVTCVKSYRERIRYRQGEVRQREARSELTIEEYPDVLASPESN